MQPPENNPIPTKKDKKSHSHLVSRLQCRLWEGALSIIVALFLTSKNVHRKT